MGKQNRKNKAPMIGAGISATVLAVAGGFIAVQMSSYQPKVWPGTKFSDDLKLDGLTAAEVDSKLKSWWSEESQRALKFEKGSFSKQFSERELTDLGVIFDLKGTIAQVRYDTYFDHLKAQLGQARVEKKINIEPQFEVQPGFQDELAEYVEKFQPPIRSAKAKFEGGAVVREYESNGMTLDESKVAEEIAKAVSEGSDIKIPVKEAPKRISDAALDKITSVYSEFSTTFSTGKVSRSKNIKRAAELIDGTVLMPGEKFSFNDHLGRRTIENGFHVAGVYVSGRHDVDVGGGICQVSTTLYNALLVGDISAKTRFPHSLPVPYVPLGRDAAVSFPNPDFAFENPFDVPIAISAIYTPGKLTFKVLSSKKSEKEVKFESKLISSWSRGEKIVHDPNLKYGQRKVMDSGGSGRKVRTWKVVYENGKEVSRSVLSDSTYSGGPRIIAVNQSAKPPKADPAEPSEAPATSADTNAN